MARTHLMTSQNISLPKKSKNTTKSLDRLSENKMFRPVTLGCVVEEPLALSSFEKNNAKGVNNI